MNRILYIIIPLIIQASTVAAFNPDTLHTMALLGIDFASSLQFHKAVEVFDQMITLDPANPQPHFLKSAAYFWMYSADMHNDQLGEEFKKYSDQAIEVAEAKLEKDENDIDALFYLGGSYGSLGRYYGIKKSYLNAYWFGKKGVNILEEVVEKDSTYYDAYLGLGIYHYLADVLPRFVKMLSFILGIEGDRERGIKELNLAVEKGVYTKSEAMFFLGAIYTYREREFDKAMNIWNTLLKKYNNNPGVLIHKGATYARMGYCEEALRTFHKVLDAINKEMLIPVSSIHYQMGNVCFKMSDFAHAIEAFSKSIETDTLFSGNRRWTYPWSHYWLGQSYELLGDRQKARYYYQKVEENDSERAFEHAREQLTNPYQLPDVKLTLVRNYISCSQFDQALAILDQELPGLLAEDTDYNRKKRMEIDYYKSQILYKKGQFNSAIHHFNEILTNKNSEEQWFKYWGYFYRGKSYQNLGMVEKALDDYELAGDSEDRSLQERIKKEYMLLGR